MTELRGALYLMVEAQQPMTVRQVFYRGVGFGLWPKSEAAYKNVVCRLLAEMRREDEIPYSWIADSTRWMRKPATFGSLEHALKNAATTYRRALWQDQDTYMEVWLEKEALAGVVVDITDPWDVPLMVTRGYPSLSFLWSAAETISAHVMVPDRTFSDSRWRETLREFKMPESVPKPVVQGKDVKILYVGDRDPSGDDIARNVAEQLEEMSECIIDFVRVAVTADQVLEYDLPTRPTKRTDSRAAKWDGEASVEVDAIEPDELRNLISAEIESCIDQRELDVILAVEAEEREMARRIVEREFASNSAA